MPGNLSGTWQWFWQTEVNPDITAQGIVYPKAHYALPLHKSKEALKYVFQNVAGCDLFRKNVVGTTPGGIGE